MGKGRLWATRGADDVRLKNQDRESPAVGCGKKKKRAQPLSMGCISSICLRKLWRGGLDLTRQARGVRKKGGRGPKIRRCALGKYKSQGCKARVASKAMEKKSLSGRPSRHLKGQYQKRDSRGTNKNPPRISELRACDRPWSLARGFKGVRNGFLLRVYTDAPRMWEACQRRRGKGRKVMKG